MARWHLSALLPQHHQARAEHDTTMRYPWACPAFCRSTDCRLVATVEVMKIQSLHIQTKHTPSSAHFARVEAAEASARRVLALQMTR
jgi:hypothetical protein